MNPQREIARLLQTSGGVIVAREHPDLEDALTRLVARQQLVRILPGVLVSPDRAREPEVRMCALARWDPDAVITGAAAARMSYWPEVRLDTIAATSRWQRRPQRGYTFSRRRIPPELVIEHRGLRLTAPSLTALDLADLDHTDALDIALRTRVVTLDSLHEALRLTSHRAGNGDRRKVLLDSRDAPWSRAERVGHRLLRTAGITGWITNYPVVDGAGLYYIDIAFVRQKLAIEIDGRLHETDLGQFESDRWRQNALVLQGWQVLRFTWAMLRDHPEHVIRAIRQALVA